MNKIKSAVVSAPAGSGKTERLARRYIELLKNGVKPERILTITFTEKAAAEMKERIFKILEQEDLELCKELKKQALKLRISTIHSFCLSLLERFAPLIGLEPEIKVLEDPTILWFDVIDDTLRKIAETEPNSQEYRMIMELIAQEGFRGLSVLRKLLQVLFDHRGQAQRARVAFSEQHEIKDLIAELANDPIGRGRILNYSDLFPTKITISQINKIKEKIDLCADVFLTKNLTPRKQGFNLEEQAWAVKMAEYRKLIISFASTIRALRIFHLFRRSFLKEYQSREQEQSLADFTDLELLTYSLITENPEWSNILYSFDEHTDHILVDEFQDTNFLQWGIIDKLSEEWRAGYGAKRARAVQPTIFLVGDEKQSIYYFRGANAQVFADAKKKLETWCERENFEYIEIKDNFRSLAAIIDFTNFLFSRLMNPYPNEPTYKTRYVQFEKKRNNDDPGSVELILIKANQAKMLQRRQKEAEIVAKRIATIIGKLKVYDDKEQPLPCRYQDITILLRKRTYLDILERALQKYKIPFVVVKGIGFHTTPEVTFLRAFVGFLVDPSSDFNLYVLLRNPIFGFSEKELLMMTNAPGLTLWERVKNYCESFGKRKAALQELEDFRAMASVQPLSQIIELMLKNKSGWKIFAEPQRMVNVKKFIRLVENLEMQSEHPMRILEYLQKSIVKENEPKANVRIEGKDAVRIMTIHAAKGLQFPIVFILGLDENLETKVGYDQSLLIEEIAEDKVVLAFQPNAELRRETKLFIEKEEKEIEEAKRLFYVAVTRARDHLFLSGVWQDNFRNLSRLRWLKDYFALSETDGKFLSNIPNLEFKVPNFLITNETFVNQEYDQSQVCEPATPSFKFIVKSEPLPYQPSYEFRVVTRELEEVTRKSTKDWTIFGEVMHQLLAEIANGYLLFCPDKMNKVLARAEYLLLAWGLPKTEVADWIGQVQKQFQLLEINNLLPIVLPQPESYAELPFMLKMDSTIYRGRVDRVICTPEGIKVYEYKTFPIDQAELDAFITKYSKQLAIYREAVSLIFKTNKVSTYLIFTALGEIIEI